MKVLPYVPVETLAAVAPVRVTPQNDNGGIVPPWLRRIEQVRPTMQPDQVYAPDVPHIMGAAQPTLYDPNPVEDFGPDVPHIM